MNLFFISLIIIFICFILMCIGLIINNKPIKKTCSTSIFANKEDSCSFCGKPLDESGDCEGK